MCYSHLTPAWLKATWSAPGRSSLQTQRRPSPAPSPRTGTWKHGQHLTFQFYRKEGIKSHLRLHTQNLKNILSTLRPLHFLCTVCCICLCFVCVWVCVGMRVCVLTNLANTSTSSPLSSRLRKDVLGVKVTLKAGSTATQPTVWEISGWQQQQATTATNVSGPTIFLHLEVRGECVLLPVVKPCRQLPSSFAVGCQTFVCVLLSFFFLSSV